jgi:hypothetical protein
MSFQRVHKQRPSGEDWEKCIMGAVLIWAVLQHGPFDIKQQLPDMSSMLSIHRHLMKPAFKSSGESYL